ncbi:MAG: autotransporter outer membrane beta-barrel domain-containing protein, partial [Deltaproteobacteria bacterium]
KERREVMRRKIFTLFVMVAFLLVSASLALAQEKEVEDITKEVLKGPGAVAIETRTDILMSFGGLVRIIPTSETNWDFGFAKKTGIDDFKIHPNEAGYVKNGYIRSEDRLYFNAIPKNRAWSFYAALEFDRALDTYTVDERGGKTDDHSDFGLERLHATMALPGTGLRLHAGWDVWGLDFGEAASIVYGDDNPGFWLTGKYGNVDFSLGYFKLGENNFQIKFDTASEVYKNADRDLYAGYLNYKFENAGKLRFFYAYDKIRNVPIPSIGGNPETDSHHVGAYYVGNYGNFETMVEAVYQFGTADAKKTPLGKEYDIKAYALSADFAYDLKDTFGFSFKPHLGVVFTTGDDDPNDDELNGYNGVENAERFSARWGGENTIIGDTNLILGTALYGYIPEFHGNGTPIMTGGLQNFAGAGNGRGDNPGLTMVSFGITAKPKKFLIYRTNVNYFIWNEDFYVKNLISGIPTKIDSGNAGTEWDNEITLALSRQSFIKGQFSFFFPGDGVKDVTRALLTEADDTAMRLAMEFIWNF